MNREETIKIMAVLQANYPDSFRGYTKEQMEGVVNLWTTILAEHTYQEVSNAVMSHIATDNNRFMPPVGVIRNKILSLTQPKEMTEQEAWQLVYKALCNSAYNSVEEFNKLPPAVQRAVGSAEMLKNWSQLDIDEVQTVIQSNVMRSFKTANKQEREVETLPKSVKEVMQQLANSKDVKQIGGV